MFQMFYPDLWLDSAYEIDYEKYYEMGYRGVLFDIDNTLVEHGAPATDRARELFERLRRIGFATCLISNNQKPRVAPFAEAVGSPYLENAHKPSVKGYEKACSLIGTTKEQTFFVGDQLFTDVYGAKRAGLHNILTKPIDPKEEIQIILKRLPERAVLRRFRKTAAEKIRTSSGTVWKRRGLPDGRGGL